MNDYNLQGILNNLSKAGLIKSAADINKYVVEFDFRARDNFNVSHPIGRIIDFGAIYSDTPCEICNRLIYRLWPNSDTEVKVEKGTVLKRTHLTLGFEKTHMSKGPLCTPFMGALYPPLSGMVEYLKIMTGEIVNIPKVEGKSRWDKLDI